MWSVTSEPLKPGFVGSRQSPGSCYFPSNVPKQGAFARPALPGVTTTTPPSVIHGASSIPRGITVARLPRAGTTMDFPCCTIGLCSACCHHYPGGIARCISRSLLQRRRSSSLLWRVDFHNDISRPAQCSLTLRPAESAGFLTKPFQRVLQPICYLLSRPLCFRPEREWPGRICTDLPNRALARHT